MPPPARLGHCSLCGLTSATDPCALCGLENDRRIVKELARAERKAVTSLEGIRVRQTLDVRT
jgi:recombinational DNA repair protein RecR